MQRVNKINLLGKMAKVLGLKHDCRFDYLMKNLGSSTIASPCQNPSETYNKAKQNVDKSVTKKLVSRLKPQNLNYNKTKLSFSKNFLSFMKL